MPRGRSRSPSPSIMEDDRPIKSRGSKRRRESNIEENSFYRMIMMILDPNHPDARDDQVHVEDEVEHNLDPPSPHFDLRVASNILENSDGSTDTTVGSESHQSRDRSGVENGREEGSVPGFSRIEREPGLPEEVNANINEEERMEEGGYQSGKEIPVPGYCCRKGSDDSHHSEAPDDPVRTQLEIENSVRVRYFNSNEVYERYDFTNRKVDAKRLAVYEKRNHILNSLEKGRVVIIEGFMGCGKTTQVPQYILDNCYEKHRICNCNIVVTQPRKIAAVSVAERVCYERNWSMGFVVGHQVELETKVDRKDTILTFMTTGVLLQKLIGSKSLKGFTHIIIDEVHERDLESDFLLLVIKKIMQAEKHVKLILMSAIDTKKFENYFVFEQNGEQKRPYVVKIPFAARHRVEEFYLDDMLLTEPDQLNVIQSNMDIEKATIQEEIYDVAVRCIISMDDIEGEANLDLRMRRKEGKGEDYPKYRGTVLVFLPGMEEINRLTRALEKEEQKKIDPDNKDYYRWAILPLHSSITADEQSRIFAPAGDMFRKIILSTNIAESSATVPDIAYVIDFCLTKSLHVDKTTNLTTLQMVWAAKSQCVQRKGRSGRVADGKVYRLVPKNHYMQLQDISCSDVEPEMRRSNLETVILMCKKFDLESPHDLLRDCMDPPKLSDIKRAVATLKEVHSLQSLKSHLGALTVEMVDRDNGGMKYVETDGDLTFVGKVMSELPIPPQCTRLILLGHCFGVMQEAIIIAAGLSGKSPFQCGFRFQKQWETYLEKMKYAKNSFSDLFALYHVYKFWIFHYGSGVYEQRKQFNEYKWARGAMVNLAVLREIKSTVELIEKRLKRLGITDSYSLPMDPNTANSIELGSEREMFLKMAIAGAFYPCYFLRRRPYIKQYVEDVNREVLRNDPFRTVYFTKKEFSPDYDGQLYSKHVADYLACGLSIPSVRFDGQKAVAIFDNSTGDTIGPFNTGMFRAIKLRQLGTELLEFRVLGKEDERKEIRRQEAARDGVRCQVQVQDEVQVFHVCPPLRMLPSVDQSIVKVRVQHVISPSQFWVVIEQDCERVVCLTRFIQENLTPIILPRSKLFPNMLCLAPFEGTYYRAKVLRADNSRNLNAKILVYFLDLGNSQWVYNSCLYDFSPFLREKGVALEPCMAIECRLKEIKPNIQHGLHWSEEAVEFMKRFCDTRKLEFEIFSIYQSTMSGELLGYSDTGPGPAQKCSLNNLLLNRKDGKLFGEKAPESYLSQENNRKRLIAHYLEREVKHAAEFEQVGDPLNRLDWDFMDPPTQGKTPVTLKGPWSPLEMSFEAMVKCSMTKEVLLENSSVNSVLLDDEPTVSNPRLLIGAQVSLTQSSACMIRDSTIMPSIPGILSLVSMIFAPRAELRVDRKQCKYNGVLCGCGTVPSPEGFVTVHPENDMEIMFDTVIDDQDVNQINIIRYNLNLILRNSQGDKSEYHKRLREEVLKLLQRTRETMTEEVWASEEHVWNRVSPKFLVTSMDLGMTFNHEEIFKPHRRVILKRLEEEEKGWDGGYY